MRRFLPQRNSLTVFIVEIIIVIFDLPICFKLNFDAYICTIHSNTHKTQKLNWEEVVIRTNCEKYELEYCSRRRFFFFYFYQNFASYISYSEKMHTQNIFKHLQIYFIGRFSQDHTFYFIA